MDNRMIFILLSTFIIFPSLSSGANKAELVDKWLKDAEAAVEKSESYTAIFHKQERIGGVLREEETIQLKFKKPFKVYMKWVKKPFKGRESLYVEGQNKNRIKAHEGGFLGLVNLNLDPGEHMAMKDNRHPITESGLEHLIKLLREQFDRALREGEFSSKLLGEEKVFGRATRKVEIILPKDKSKGYYCYRVVINLDKEKSVPIKIQVYDWENRIVEIYGYEDLDLDAGLTDSDFDPDNPKYGF